MNDAPLVELRAIAIWTPEQKPILRDISWTVRRGERWVILGANGAGKTTLLSVVSAERHPSKGDVHLLGETIGRTDMRELRRRIGKVDGSQRMLDWLTGQEAVLTGLRNTIWPRFDDWDDADYASAREMLDLVGSRDYAEREIKTLSSGERQRIRIARALIQNPELLLLDEPATGLDFPAREALLASIDELVLRKPGLPLVMVSHHLEDLPASMTHAILLRDGRIIDQGAITDMLTSDNVSACYGFPIHVDHHDGRWSARARAGWTVQHRAEGVAS